MVSEQRGFNHNNDTYSTILHKLAKSRKFNAVDAILRQMTFETCRFHEGLFLNLMTHFSNSSLHERTLEMFYAIPPIVREKPSLKAISTCLNLLTESGRLDLAKKLLSYSKKSLDLKPNTCIFNISVKHHCRNGDLESAFEVVKEMRKSKVSYPNLITYSTLMGGLCDTGRLKEAVELFEEMVSKDQVMPDALTYNVLINGFCRGGKVDRARKIMDFMRKNGCCPNVFNYSALMNGFCKEGRVEEAEEVFDEMRKSGMKADVVGYTTLINCLCRVGRVDEAIELLKEMKEKECRADAITFNVILGGLCRERRFEEAMEMLEKLPYEGFFLNKASYRIVLNFLCKEREMERAINLLVLMMGRGFVPHFATSNELLVCLCEAGKVADATTALYGLGEMGFKPEPNSWAQLVESICRERKLVRAFELLDELEDGGNCGKWCTDHMEKHLKQSVLSRLPHGYQWILKQSISSEDDDMVPEPQLDTFVFCKSKGSVGSFQLDERAGRVDEAINLLKEMKEECRVDAITFNVILGGEGDGKGNRLVGSDDGRGFVAPFATSNELQVCLCEAGKVADATTALYGLGEMGIKPEPNSWAQLVESICRERKLVRAFELLDELVIAED
ncbi:hypothetical protein HHK36_008163 [Tetracentron sinense]|uniref:Pentatricopeptide repeat-containing protein n=1 Tax=Tetracentron sinense TaxID=13715 RepID=A0A835DJ21_TETSI|nr:hypothetical protein HHK36_008163 [Tetracentron sinense]